MYLYSLPKSLSLSRFLLLTQIIEQCLVRSLDFVAPLCERVVLRVHSFSFRFFFVFYELIIFSERASFSFSLIRFFPEPGQYLHGLTATKDQYPKSLTPLSRACASRNCCTTCAYSTQGGKGAAKRRANLHEEELSFVAKRGLIPEPRPGCVRKAFAWTLATERELRGRVRM